MGLIIRINNLNKKRRISRRLIKKAASLILGGFRKHDALVDITFVSNGKIAALNKKYMGREGPTDVLSFLLEEKTLPRRNFLIGDIYISSDAAHGNAKRFKTDFLREILLYTAHGVLHLMGFGDKTVKEKRRIRKLEERFLAGLCHDRSFSRV